jgi:hypothetical protein
LWVVREGVSQEVVVQDRIDALLRQGFRVVSQTQDGAQLVRPKRFSMLWFLGWTVFSCGTLFWVYLIWYVAKRDSTVYLRADGSQVRRGTWR